MWEYVTISGDTHSLHYGVELVLKDLASCLDGSGISEDLLCYLRQIEEGAYFPPFAFPEGHLTNICMLSSWK